MPSLLNPLGVKGLGGAGAIPGPALLASALEDALRPLGVRITRMPLTPSDLAAHRTFPVAPKRAPDREPASPPGASCRRGTIERFRGGHPSGVRRHKPSHPRL